MKKRGFTLIELLAVIVILGIIALIAAPIVLNIINNVKKESEQRSIEMYASALESAVGNYQMKNPNDKNITVDKLSEIMQEIYYDGLDGDKVICENEEIYSDGTIWLNNCKIGNNKKVSDISYGTKKLCWPSKVLTNNFKRDGNFETNEDGSLISIGVLASTVEDKYDYGVEYTCNLGDGERHFYVLQDGDKDGYTIYGNKIDLNKYTGTPTRILQDEGYGTAGPNEVALIMDSNITWKSGTIDIDRVVWAQTDDNSKGPLEANEHLPSIEVWSYLEKDQISLPTYDQIYNVSFHKSSQANKGNVIELKWLYTNLGDCQKDQNGDCAYNAQGQPLNMADGYWTLSASKKCISGYSDYTCARTVYKNGYINNSPINKSNGVRPVITISKDNILFE